ncbi:class I SAM-dependent methyltransferase [Leptolyngbya sp. AN02str]|uniref:class I SAM-dependent methyltransferase n=1 Tax=Leptolyngbya sp. AN02str TaxID=3423363 RepID=UPI003D32408C
MNVDTNQKTYESPGIVWHYAQLQQLQPAESAILNLLRDRLADMKMLDIGVGGGRTTLHFSPVVKDYTGVDYSAEMIAACRQRFSASAAQFAVCDARDMSQFDDQSFDLILFSFNGIDYVSHGDRLKILQEIHRIGKPGGYFCFSSHNLQGFAHSFRLRNQLSLNPIRTYVNLMMLGCMRLMNRPLTQTNIQCSDYLIVKDESHNFRLNTYYIYPQRQLAQLMPYFGNVKIYSWSSGQELATEKELCSNVDAWLYYLCEIQ